MTAVVLNGILILMVVFISLLALAGVLTLSRRMDRAERRRVYETECLVKSLQALEQQNLMLNERVGGVVDAGQRLATELDRAVRQSRTEEPQTAPLPPSGRILH
jgi:hypothetical protein